MHIKFKTLLVLFLIKSVKCSFFTENINYLQNQIFYTIIFSMYSFLSPKYIFTNPQEDYQIMHPYHNRNIHRMH